MCQQTQCLLMHRNFYQHRSLNHNDDKKRSVTIQAINLENKYRNFVQARNQVLTKVIVSQDNIIECDIKS